METPFGGPQISRSKPSVLSRVIGGNLWKDLGSVFLPEAFPAAAGTVWTKVGPPVRRGRLKRAVEYHPRSTITHDPSLCTTAGPGAALRWPSGGPVLWCGGRVWIGAAPLSLATRFLVSHRGTRGRLTMAPGPPGSGVGGSVRTGAGAGKLQIPDDDSGP